MKHVFHCQKSSSPSFYVVRTNMVLILYISYFALIYMVCLSRDFFEERDTHNKRDNAPRILKEKNALNSRKFETIAVNFCSVDCLHSKQINCSLEQNICHHLIHLMMTVLNLYNIIYIILC